LFAQYEATLSKQNFLGGNALSKEDHEAMLKVLPFRFNLKAKDFPHTFAWFSFVCKFSQPFRDHQGITVSEASAAAPAPPKAVKKAEEEDLDLFGDDNEEDAAAAKAAAEKAKTKKKEKKPVIAQSLVLFEVKPLDDTTNLDDMAAEILKIQGDGIYWKTEYKKEPVAYGIFKLIIGVTVEDEKVSVDGLQEQIEALTDYVQSVEILAFNKI